MSWEIQRGFGVQNSEECNYLTYDRNGTARCRNVKNETTEKRKIRLFRSYKNGYCTYGNCPLKI